MPAANGARRASPRAILETSLRRSASWMTPLIGGLATLALFGGTLAWLLFHERDARNWVRHTTLVRETFAEERIMALTSEATKRDYLLTGNLDSLRAYESLSQQLPGKLAAVRAMTKDNPDQQKRLLTLDALIAEQTRIGDAAVALRQMDDPEAGIALIDAADQRAKFRQRVALATAILDEEIRLDRARQAKAARFESATTGILGMGVLVLLLVTLLAARDRRQRFQLLEQVNAQLASDNARRQIAERELDLLARHATDAVFRLGLDGRFLYASPSVSEILGVSPDELIGRSLFSSLHPEDHAVVFTALHRLRVCETERITISYRVGLSRAPGQWIWLEASSGLIRDEHGAPFEIIASVRNVDRRKQLEFALRDARKAAEAATIAKSTFLANMSHEIRTPMNGIVGFADLLRTTVLDGDQRRYVDLIAESGEVMTRLLNDILDFSKVEAGQMVLASEPFDLHQTLQACVTLVTPTILKKGLDIRLDLAPDLPRHIEGDALRLRQIILNLLGNAAKFTQAGSIALTGSVNATDGGPMLAIAVQDSGVGIPPERQKAIFDPFVQADAGAAASFGGTGLGLPISAQLAGLMGGRLDLSSEPGRGTLVTLTLPLRAITPAEQDAAEASTDAAPTVPARHGLRVLVAEDHDVNQMLVLSMLRQLGCSAEIVGDGAQAVDRVRANRERGEPYALLLMDLHMPEMDGLEATRQIRALGIDADALPIIALTANAYAEDIEASLTAGMQDHVAKPFKLADLDAALHRWAKADTATAVVEPVTEPAVAPSIDARYRARKKQTLGRLEEACRLPTLDAAIIEELAGMLHKLAGTAGMFDDEILGECARALEEALLAAATEDSAHLLREAMPGLRAAA